MEVGQVRDPQTVELLGQPGQLQFAHPQANPARFEPPPRHAHCGERKHAARGVERSAQI